MNKKELAAGFLRTIAAGDVRGAYERFAAPTFIHHNQYFKGDRQSLMLAMEEAGKAHPQMQLDIKMIIEEGDRVMTYSHVKHKPGDLGVAVVHISRFHNDKIVELWDLGQQISNESPNENGLF